MATTPVFALRYPVLGDAPNGPLAFQNLATDVENLITGSRGLWRQDTTGQAIATATDTKITFNTAHVTASNIAYSGGVFTVGKAGRWRLTAATVHPWVANLESWVWLGPSAATTTRWDLSTKTAPATLGPPQTHRCGIERVFTLSETFAFWTWHNKGSNSVLDVAYGGTTHLEATFLGAA